jgi:hypothetical protein
LAKKKRDKKVLENGLDEEYMKARFGLGLSVSMAVEDKNNIHLECIVKGYNNPKLILTVSDYVSNQFLESPGFHISTPEKESFERCKEVYINIDRTVWRKVFEEYDSEFDGGFFISRSPYDRIDITCWTPDRSYWDNYREK